MTRPPEQIRPYLRLAGFEYVAYMVEFEHDWPLALGLIERWMSKCHTFHLPCREITITLQDVAYQLGLRIDGDPVSGCIGGWEQHHQGRTIEELFCGELEQDAIEERLLRYTRGYIMQLIGGILFPYESDSRVHIRWLPLLKDLETCGRLSWGSAVLTWLYRQMCRATEHGQRNLGGCVSLLLSWAYHHILLLRPDGCDTHWFSLVERWVQYRPDNARGESRLRHYRRTLNRIGMLNLIGLVPPAIAEVEASTVVVCPLLCFAIVKWHQVDRWEHIELFGLGDQHLVVAGVVPEDLPIHHPLAPDLHQPEDGHLPEMRPAAGGGRGRGRGRARGRGRHGARRGRQGGNEVHRNRDPVSQPAHRAEDAG
ncbi:protein MAIN-LIKE 1-like [Arachis hypogaea]|uniref:protein MAIN-LIKE 1-like n=1 Tax=Arachis hypogaea TaxID=3818 RepID=UPI003B21A5A2